MLLTHKILSVGAFVYKAGKSVFADIPIYIPLLSAGEYFVSKPTIRLFPGL